ncbi:unnamed protein product [Phyllotreta striolata]|uniref:Uncharacterized protein n=1 Tax=Phyllotreta striolata TaxID=444603 RepID=A0A9N9TSF5_PHYSR|nr:unnamed protein product [Phyllotreta striolata]
MGDEVNTALSEQQQWEQFVISFYNCAMLQGTVAYLLMSIYAVAPQEISSYLGFDLAGYLWSNMVYGLSVVIFSRPTFRSVSPSNRIAFALLGSLMFNHASMNCFSWIHRTFPERPYVRGFLGFFAGRIMMVHFLAFLYHMDTRTITPGVRMERSPVFEQIYNTP